MEENDISLLKKALELYEFTIEQRKTSNYDNNESNEFYNMKEKLSNILGVDLC